MGMLSFLAGAINASGGRPPDDGWNRPVPIVTESSSTGPINWLEPAYQSLPASTGAWVGNVPASQSKRARKSGRWAKLKNWWKTRGAQDVTQFAAGVGQAVGELRAARQTARATVTDFAGQIRDEYESGVRWGEQGTRPPARQAVPWWLWLILLALLAIVLVLILRRS